MPPHTLLVGKHMQFKALKAAASLAAAVVAFGPSAHAGTLVTGYSPDGSFGSIGLIDPGDLTPTGATASVGDVATGLTWGAGSLFVSTGSHITRYNTALDSIGATALGGFDYGPLAYGDDMLFAGYDGFITNGVLRFDNAFNLIPGYIDLPVAPSGLAYGDGVLFVSYGSTLARYGTDGTLLGAHDYGALASFGALAYGGGTLYAGLTVAAIGGDLHGLIGVDAFDLTTMDVTLSLDDPVTGLAFGDGALFAGFAHEIVKYDPSGATLDNLALGGLTGGPLAFIPSGAGGGDCGRGTRVCDPGGAVPEPATWAMMILGFGLTGAVVRRRRPVLRTA